MRILSPADGVALGAAASTSQTSVQLIVFVAIMLHKVTAAELVGEGKAAGWRHVETAVLVSIFDGEPFVLCGKHFQSPICSDAVCTTLAFQMLSQHSSNTTQWRIEV